MVIYATERNFCGSFPGKIFLGEVLAVQPMVDAWEINFLQLTKQRLTCCLWTLGPGNTPSYYLACFKASSYIKSPEKIYHPQITSNR